MSKFNKLTSFFQSNKSQATQPQDSPAVSAKILHIQPDAEERALIRQILENTGHTILEVEDGPGGLQLAQEEQPDLILIDANTPDGADIAQQIKKLEALNNIPLIQLRPWAEGEFGFDGYIHQPVNPTSLPHQILLFLQDTPKFETLERENARLRKYNQVLTKRLEQKIRELTAANEALAHTDKMKSRFINMAAHELRTPLAAVHGYLSVLITPGGKLMTDADENTLELIEGVVTGIERLQGLAQDMLDVTRIEAGTLQLKHAPIGLPLIFEKIRKDFKNAVTRRQQTLIVGKSGDIPVMWVDGERVTQILRNLVSNAIKYTPDGGTIELSAELMHSDDQNNHFVKITVTDSGVGVPQDKHEQIFEGFYEVREIELHSTSKTDFMGGGAGLGLPIARGVAEAHGGSLWVESSGYDPQTYPGSKFHLILPLGQAPAPKS